MIFQFLFNKWQHPFDGHLNENVPGHLLFSGHIVYCLQETTGHDIGLCFPPPLLKRSFVNFPCELGKGIAILSQLVQQ